MADICESGNEPPGSLKAVFMLLSSRFPVLHLVTDIQLNYGQTVNDTQQTKSTYNRRLLRMRTLIEFARKAVMTIEWSRVKYRMTKGGYYRALAEHDEDEDDGFRNSDEKSCKASYTFTTPSLGLELENENSTFPPFYILCNRVGFIVDPLANDIAGGYLFFAIHAYNSTRILLPLALTALLFVYTTSYFIGRKPQAVWGTDECVHTCIPISATGNSIVVGLNEAKLCWPIYEQSRCSSDEAREQGFTVVIDMRGATWSTVKPILKVLQEHFPGSVHIAYIIKPDNFWQKQRTSLGSHKYKFEVHITCHNFHSHFRVYYAHRGATMPCPFCYLISSVRNYAMSILLPDFFGYKAIAFDSDGDKSIYIPQSICGTSMCEAEAVVYGWLLYSYELSGSD
ncbi:hypothetical protein ANN_06997 [Periplaneta americana]|uniref:CRAL-TRIO domain-containing protein n=1 Tax=Periplaneta americana TaxID=6978 RepID=A0ABQ8TF17_PERAM|nr:hypothetical protein ANN_06997 [Periplaneta americana]